MSAAYQIESDETLLKIKEFKKKLNILFTEYNHTCGDGCCLSYGTITTINSIELPFHNQDAETIVRQILEHLGYEVETTCIEDE